MEARGKTASKVRSVDEAQAVLEQLYQRDHPTPYFVCPVLVDYRDMDYPGVLEVSLLIDRIDNDKKPRPREYDNDDFVFTGVKARVGFGPKDKRYSITVTIPYGAAHVDPAEIKIPDAMFRTIERSTTTP